MKQYQLQEDYNGFAAQTIFNGPFPIKGQSNKGYVPNNITPGPEGAEMCLFASFVEGSPIFTEVKQQPNTPAK